MTTPNMKTSKKQGVLSSISGQFFFSIGLLIFATIALQTFFATKLSLASTSMAAEQIVLNKVENVGDTSQWRLSSILNFMVGFAQASILRDKNATVAERENFFTMADDNVLKMIDKYGGFRFFDANGNHVKANGKIENVSDKEWFTLGIKGTTSVFESVINSPNGDRIVLLHAATVYDENKEIIGVIAADISRENLIRQVTNTKVGENGYAYIVGGGGNIIADKNMDINKKCDNVFTMTPRAGESEKIKFIKKSIEISKTGEEKSGVGFYKENGVNYIGAWNRFDYDDFIAFIAIPEDEVFADVTALGIILIAIAVISLLLSVIVLIFIIKRLTKPIVQTTNVLKKISSGDFTVRLDVKGKTELSEMANEFNIAMDNIGHMVNLISESTVNVKQAGNTLSQNITETVASINQINEHVNVVKQQVTTQSTSVQDTNIAIKDIGKIIQTLNSNIEIQSTNVVESSSAIEQMVANINSVTNILESNSQSIQRLKEKSLEVKQTAKNSVEVSTEISSESEGLFEAINVIKNIAGQTNLLAMNAAIEAAHAGDSGKGFAVVADEIRKLAEESNIQSKQISQVLKNLKVKIDGIATETRKAEDLFLETYKLTEEVKTKEETIINAMHEQNTGSTQVLQAIEDISTITGKVKSGADEMVAGSTQVINEIKRLTEITETIATSMNEMSLGTIRIENAMHEINNSEEINKNSIEKLEVEVKKFKI